MKINITKKQYWDLMRATYIANWVANAICEGDIKEDDGIKEIRNYVFSFAKEFGYDKYVKYDSEFKDYFSNWELDEEPSTRKLIDRYDEEQFWEELEDRLASRDFLRKHSKVKTEKMDYEILWDEEFVNHGLDRLEIVKKEK